MHHWLVASYIFKKSLFKAILQISPYYVLKSIHKWILHKFIYKTLYSCVLFLQLRIEAFDDNFPDNKASTTLIVSVLRNVFSPEFTESSYEQIVLPNIELGTEILAVNATDKDKVRNSWCDELWVKQLDSDSYLNILIQSNPFERPSLWKGHLIM